MTGPDKGWVIVTGHAPLMAGSESVATLGARRSGLLRLRIAEELVNARIQSGVSLREVARKVEISVDRLKRAERGDASALTIDLAARIAPVVGLLLAASLHANGDPVRDRAHLALLERFQRRLHPSLTWRTEVPMPIAGDLRGADGVIGGTFGTIVVEAETRVADVQAVERKASLKKRDLGADRLVLLLADTPNNRKVSSCTPSSASSSRSALVDAWPRSRAETIREVTASWSSEHPPASIAA